MPRKTAKVTATAAGAGAQAKRTRQVALAIAGLDQSAQSVATDAETIYREHAPRRSGRLARGIKVTAAGDTAVLTVKAIDPQSGYDYVAVSRLGHRKRYIFPVRAKRLVFKSRGRMWYLMGVRGFRPKSDWVKNAFPEVKAAAEAEMRLTGNRITARWGGSG